MEKRHQWIDICRGIAIILVVVGHVVSSFHNSGKYVNATFFNHVGGVIYSFHMPLFFAISGFLASNNSAKNKKWIPIQKKLIAYGIPYLVFSLLAVILKVTMKAFVNSPLAIKDLAGIFLFPISSLWFLYALLIISIIHVVIIGLMERSSGTYIVLIMSFLLMCFAYQVKNGVLYSDSWLKESIIIDSLYYFFWYEIGAIMLEKYYKKIEKEISQRRSVVSIITIILLVAYIGAVVILRNAKIANVLIHTLKGLIGICIMISLSILISRFRLLEDIGKGTMEIYLLHGYIVSATRVIINKLNILDSMGIVPLFICGLAGVCIPIIMYLLIKHIIVIDFCFYPQHYLKPREQNR